MRILRSVTAIKNNPAKALAATAIFHIALTLTLFGVGRLRVAPQQFDRAGQVSRKRNCAGGYVLPISTRSGLWWILLALSGVMIGGACGQVISGAFYAIGDTRTPTMLFIGTYTVYIPIKIVVFLRYEVIGLALVTSAHLAINFLQFAVLESSIARTAAVRKTIHPTAGI